VLGIEPIGIDDDFLDIGGDSLSATRVAGRILDAFRIDLSPRDLLDATTVARTAALIVARQRASQEPADR
jgi:acyl carrier protein